MAAVSSCEEDATDDGAWLDTNPQEPEMFDMVVLSAPCTAVLIWYEKLLMQIPFID